MHYFIQRKAGCRRQAPSSQPPPEPQSKQQTGELALALGRFFSLELIAAVIRTAQEMGLGGFSSLQQWSGKSQILSEPQALFLAKDLSEHRNVFFFKGKAACLSALCLKVERLHGKPRGLFLLEMRFLTSAES